MVSVSDRQGNIFNWYIFILLSNLTKEEMFYLNAETQVRAWA
jgi:hypothetical protein